MSLLKWVNSLHNSVNKKLNLPPITLQTKLAEMDNNNPALKQIPIQQQLPLRRAGPTSYGIKKVYVKPIPEPIPATIPATHVGRRAGAVQYSIKQVVSIPVTEPVKRGYGIRKAKTIRVKKSSCVNCQ